MKFFRPKHHEAPPKDGEAGTVSVDGDDLAATGSGPGGFGCKIAWLAIRTEDTEGAAEALRVTDARAASWAEGIDAVYGAAHGRAPVFLAPVVDG